ncbi:MULTISPECIES: GntR family transcriptional regulator [Deefgea]|uniref:GntR family transcriptional regulator n=1 Tax=Deefgea piscis TaxID=2739061 RepID=A0A6M8SX41_9NEIS|nr:MULTISPECIES: GntR family transcriptional regulator [Deefgea]MBM5573301.1 GntR family transcriptional regulator [Deefgea sp. CFH1-16]QKJ67169.1 GntR family transcriptional regulator [Deefgea piscis]
MFILNPALPTPIYRQIQDQVRRLIAGGQLLPGTALPSVRELAEIHAVNPMTISKAYSLLEAEGLLARQRGKPMTVAEHPPPHILASLQLHTILRDTITAARQLGLSDAELIAALHAELNQDQDHE